MISFKFSELKWQGCPLKRQRKDKGVSVFLQKNI